MADAAKTKDAASKVDPKTVSIEEAAAVSAGEFLSEPSTVTALTNGTTVRTF
jgi:hypothetical protein